jgi:regulator of PEP synthase PpsR (kinase-PPPase family)
LGAPRLRAIDAATLSPVTKQAVELHVISDSTGETAVRLVHALEAQFPDQEFEEIRHPRVETVDDLQLALNRAKGRPAVIVYTLVHPDLREAARALCRRYRLHYCDLLGHPIEAVAKVAGVAAQMTPGARAPLDSTYFRRMAAIEFAVKYDDGVGAGLHEADIILVGVSRTSKTPLSMYLGYLGYKTANVPIVKGIEPPSALFEVDPTKVVGLTIDAVRLQEIRRQRAARLGGDQRAYSELLEIYAELEEAEAIQRRLGCPVIEISDLSIEETAARAIRLVERRRAEAGAKQEAPVS